MPWSRRSAGGRIDRPDAGFAYTRRILTQAATRRWQSETRLLEVTAPDPVPWSAAGDPTDADIGLDVRAAISRPSAKQQAVMVLRYYQDLTEAQIAEAPGCSRGSVKRHAARAMAALGPTTSSPCRLLHGGVDVRRPLLSVRPRAVPKWTRH